MVIESFFMLETLELYPSCEFWESDLEIPVKYLLERFQNKEVRKLWLDSLSGKQLSTIFQNCSKCLVNKQLFTDGNYDNTSVQQKRRMLTNYSEDLFSYYLISYFDRTKLEFAVSEIARSALTEGLMASYLVKSSTKYDKRSLLFLLFHEDCNLLKSVYHFDKIQRKGFISFALQRAPRQLATPLKDFISKETIRQILKEDDDKRNDGFETQLQGLFYHQDRTYILIRRASDIDLVLNSNRVVHGHKPDWVILDFSLSGTQANFGAKNIDQAAEIANSIVSSYFKCECVFVNVKDQNFAAQVYKFLKACVEGSDSEICVFEVKFKLSCFKNSNTYLTLTVKPYDTIEPELHVLKLSTGNVLQSIQSIKIMFKDKRLTLSLKSNGEYIAIYYSEHPLNKREREDLKAHMEQSYGLTILSRANL